VRRREKVRRREVRVGSEVGKGESRLERRIETIEQTKDPGKKKEKTRIENR
jgi:hypothetical protein